ncbi:MAG: recombinase family protein [Oscillospiraceae bacterium]|nr:recombinase family protein [Oscillospiraceae bacterium]
MTFVRNEPKEKTISMREWRLGAYTRLSKEDGDKPQSDSIENQQKIINNYIDWMKRQGENVASVEVYTDDGYAGGSFDRPDYKRLISDIEVGAVNCVIFKDLSRLGRNYPELGRLLEDYFPSKGVRVISILNSLDSVKSPETYCSSIVSFSNIVNDDYIRQLSVKIKSTLKMKRNAGEFIGNYAPYGYVKSPEDRHKLVIDPEAAEIVQTIFDWYTDGASTSAIVKRLNALHIPPPSVYKTERGCKGYAHHPSGKKQNLWSLTKVRSILQDEVYIGNLVQGKYKSASYRSKRMVPNERSNWTVIEGTHEAIISDEQFTLVHERFQRNARVSAGREDPYLLSGFVFCGCCGRRMNRCVSNGNARFRCPTRTYAPDKCQGESISEKQLERIVLQAVRSQISELVDARAAVIEAQRAANGISDTSEYSAALSRAKREKKRLTEAKFKLYDSLQSGLIDESEYEQFRSQYTEEIKVQEDYIAKLQESLQDLKEARRADDEFVEFFSRYGNLPTLDRPTVIHLIDRIIVHDREHIEIHFKFSKECEKVLDLAKNEEESGEYQKAM